MKKIIFKQLLFLCIASCFLSAQTSCKSKTKILKSELQDKIKGGWAGQLIGCTYGLPTEFKYIGVPVPDDYPYLWDNERCKWYFENNPGVYDDISMDLTFVDVFEKEGMDAPTNSLALAFANAKYHLWHANQAARYNILNGIMPPESGYWKNNPHSEDIDFQIEADFAGLMSPGMVNNSSEICNKVGHIMNYGDGVYGGVYVAAMYSLAFISDDVDFVVKEALKSIPQKSTFYQCMNDVIKWHENYPNDWKQTWEMCEQKWSSDIGCPKGSLNEWNIDAKFNAAYILIGLLYGNGDFGETIKICTHCGQDSDSNPANAAGILGTILGYKNIPEVWKAPIYPVENLNFKFCNLSINDAYAISYKHALEMLKRNGAKFEGETIEIPLQSIKPLPFEAGFEGLLPKEIISNITVLDETQSEFTIEFDGKGFALRGEAINMDKENQIDYTFNLEMEVDGKKIESFIMPTLFLIRRTEIAWNYDLDESKHILKIRVLNPKNGYKIDVGDLITYTSTPSK